MSRPHIGDTLTDSAGRIYEVYEVNPLVLVTSPSGEFGGLVLDRTMRLQSGEQLRPVPRGLNAGALLLAAVLCLAIALACVWWFGSVPGNADMERAVMEQTEPLRPRGTQ